MNIATLLKKSVIELKQNGIDTAELDAKVLLEHAVDKDRAFVFSHPDYLITNAQYSRFRRFIRRRKRGEPIAYISGHKEFYGYDFLVNKNVLIPRPESEWLVEKGTQFLLKLKDQRPTRLAKAEPRRKTGSGLRATEYGLRILDMGTGSGCLAIALSKSIPATSCQLLATVQIYAVDLNKRGLAISKKNAKRLNCENVKFFHSNLFSNQKIKNKIFDLILANLPYVPKNRSSKFEFRSSIAFEPQDAIFAEDNGTAIIKKFLKETRAHLSPAGLILLELDPRNAKEILNFSKKLYPKAKIALRKDLAGKNRYLSIKN